MLTSSGLGIERAADRRAIEHRPLVQQMHGVAEQDLGLEIGAAVGGEHVVQVERQRRVGQPLAADVTLRDGRPTLRQP